MPNKSDTMIVYGPDGDSWYVVAQAAGITNAEIVAGLLRSAHIPVYLYREAAGSSALALTVGLLGMVNIAVPEVYYDDAMDLLDADSAEGADFGMDEIED